MPHALAGDNSVLQAMYTCAGASLPEAQLGGSLLLRHTTLSSLVLQHPCPCCHEQPLSPVVLTAALDPLPWLLGASQMHHGLNPAEACHLVDPPSPDVDAPSPLQDRCLDE